MYTLQMLHHIGQLTKTQYHCFHLPVVPRLVIIAIGLRKTKLGILYHQSKAGLKLSHKIHSITPQHKPNKQTSSKLNTNNLIKITNQKDRLLHQNTVISHINARSIIPKVQSFQENIMSRDSDLCVLTETWLKGDNERAHKSIPLDGYKITLHPRTNGVNGGGIALIYKEFLKVNKEQ